MHHISAKKWTPAHAAHLANRAGFGLPPQRLAEWAQRNPQEIIEELVGYTSSNDSFDQPVFTKRDDAQKPFYSMMMMASASEELTEEEKREMRNDAQKQVRQDLVELRAWWLYRMRHTEHPLQEKLTLFWHGHFATSIQKVKKPYPMYAQNQTLRKYSNGNFGELVNAISKDPAMLLYLDNAKSSRKSPNENFARELMELFTLGEGHYTEQDIKASARAFTGHSIDRQNFSYTYRKRMHDPGTKTFMGQSGYFGGEDITRIILEQPQAARYICAKLWTYFAYDQPEQEIIDHLAGIFRNHQYDLKPVLREMFSLEAFYDPSKAIRQQIKSPVQWYMQAQLTLDARPLPPRLAQTAMMALGQSLFEPPNVKGWDGGSTWITTANLLNRYNLAGAMVKGMATNRRKAMREDSTMMGAMQPNMLASFRANLSPVFDVGKVLPESVRSSHEATQKHLFNTLFQSDLRARDRKAFAEFMAKQPAPKEWRAHHVGEALHVLMSTPQYQLT